MPIRIECPNCKKVAHVPDSAIGKSAKCKCGTSFVVGRQDTVNPPVIDFTNAVSANTDADVPLVQDSKKKIALGVILASVVGVAILGFLAIRALKQPEKGTAAYQANEINNVRSILSNSKCSGCGGMEVEAIATIIVENSTDPKKSALSLAALAAKDPTVYTLPFTANLTVIVEKAKGWKTLGLSDDDLKEARMVIHKVREDVVMTVSTLLRQKHFSLDKHLLTDDQIDELCEAVTEEFGDDREKATRMLFSADSKSHTILQALYNYNRSVDRMESFAAYISSMQDLTGITPAEGDVLNRTLKSMLIRRTCLNKRASKPSE